MEINLPRGAAPFNTNGLLHRHLTTQEELNALEFANINQAMGKYLLGSLTEKKAPFTLEWLFQVHREMFEEVWDWAGKPRNTEFKIGVLPAQIPSFLKQLLDDLKYWEGQTTMEPIEIASHLHHRLVQIHPFENGNSRWARLLTNIYLKKQGLPLVQWPEGSLGQEGDIRDCYIDALKAADRGDSGALIDLHREYQGKSE